MMTTTKQSESMKGPKPRASTTICDYCTRSFNSKKDVKEHMDKDCKKAKNMFRKKVRERVKEISRSSSADDDSGISMEEEEDRGRLEGPPQSPVKIKINLKRKRVLSMDMKSKKQKPEGAAAKFHVASTQSLTGPTRSSVHSAPAAGMVEIKQELLADIGALSIKQEPGVGGRGGISPGIRVSLEKEQGEGPWSVALTSHVQGKANHTADKASMQQQNATSSGKVKGKDLRESAPSKSESTAKASQSAKNTKVTFSKSNFTSLKFTRTDNKQQTTNIGSEKSSKLGKAMSVFEFSNESEERPEKKKLIATERVEPEKQKQSHKRRGQKEKLEGNKQDEETNVNVPNDKEIVTTDTETKGSFWPLLPPKLVGSCVAFDSTFLSTHKMVFCYRVGKDEQVCT